MIRFALLLIVWAAVSGTAAAQPLIAGVSPDSGPAAGGTEVTITGSGFSICQNCSPPIHVLFGRAAAQQVTVINANTLRAVAPPHLPGTFGVSVQAHDGSVTLPNAFTYTGSIEEDFHRVLLPLMTGPVHGAFGSRFFTELRLANSSTTEPTRFFGLIPQCRVSTCLMDDPIEQAYDIAPAGTIGGIDAFEQFGQPGLFLYMPKSAPRIQANLRVYDGSRRALNFGTEIPVVQDHEMTDEPIQLLGVPLDPRFRNTLRVYATEATFVTVEYDGVIELVPLRPGATLLDPAYAQYSNFPNGPGTIDVTIRPVAAAKVWAFISVTNNETQLITTISPQR